MEPRCQIWKPLAHSQRQIRLFVLEPAQNRNAVLAGKLIIRSVDQQLHYDAISHTWGRPSHSETIFINELEWVVTASVSDVLRRLRDPIDKKCFWIDALCINQYDRKELAKQVKLMQYIFNRAATVQVWLGQEPSSIESLIDDFNEDTSLRHLFSKRRSAQEIGQTIERLFELTQLEYWSRTWILQEVTLARNVRFVFGRKAFTLTRLSSLYERFHAVSSKQRSNLQISYWDYINQALYPIISAPELFQVATMGSLEYKALRLTKVLQRVRHTKCHDPRDRVYGLLGIMTAMFGPEFLEANYECNRADVYTNFARRLMAATHCLVLLNQAECIYDPMEELPSWVPNLSSPFSHYDAYRRLSYYPRFQAAGKYSTAHAPRAPEHSSTSRLHCMGHIFSTVKVIGGCCPSVTRRGTPFGPPERRQLALLMKSWAKLSSGGEIPFVRTITMDTMKVKPSVLECFVAVQTSRSKRTSTQKEINGQIRDAISDRRFFLTAEGLPALGPRDARKGDVLVIFAGGRVPYVLRKSPRAAQEGLELYSYVGECYVHGIMYGELLKGPNTPKFVDIWLE